MGLKIKGISFRKGEVKKFLKGIKFGQGVKKFLDGTDNQQLAEMVTVAMGVVDNLRETVASEDVDLLVKAIPGELDDKLRVELGKVIPLIVAGEAKTRECLAHLRVEDQIICLFNVVDKGEPSDKAIFYQGFAAKIARHLMTAASGKTVPINDILLTVASLVAHLFVKKSAA